MKKIMKKALSLMLALVMVFSLAPMTASAATGDYENPEVLVADGSVNTSEYTNGGDAYFYVYTPSENGTLTLKAECEDVYVTIQAGNASTYIDYNPAQDYLVETAEMAVTAGTTYNISAMTSSFTTGTVKFSATFEAGTGSSVAAGDSMETAIDATNMEAITVPARSTKYFYVTGMYSYGAEYTLTVDGGMSAGMNGGVGIATFFNGNEVASATGDTAASALAVGMMANGGSIYFSVTNPGFYDGEYRVTVVEGAPSVGGLGSAEEPDELTIGGPFELALDGNEYHYEWTATEAGTFTLTMLNNLCADGWTYQVGDGSPYSTGWGEEDKNVCEVTVATGDVVTVVLSVPTYLADYDSYDPYTPGTGTVWFSTAFTAGSGSEDGDDSGDNDNDDQTPTEGVITPGEGDVNYAQSTAPIVVGDNTLTVSNDYAYTIFTFEPTTPGTYTLTSEDSLMGIVSYNGMWVTIDPSAETVSADTIEWECTGVGQSIWVAVMAQTNIANITVEWEELVVEEIPSENAYPTVSLETYVFDGNLDKLESLMYGINDGEVFIAQDDDGFYHVIPIDKFNDDMEYVGEEPLEDYPLALVKLNDSVISLASAIGYGNVKWVSYNTEGETPVAEYIIYFNDMLTEYISYSSTDAKLYPLTDDLAYTMILVGEDQNWYGEDGIVSKEYANDDIEEDFLMFFAMYYLDQDITTLDKEEPVVEKEEMTNIIASNKDKDTVINTVVTNAAGEEVEVKFTFEAGTMKPVDGKEEYSFKVELIEDYNKATADKAEIEKDEFVIRINFEYDGQLPAKATISIPVGTAYANKTLFYYQILADGTLKYVCDAPVDAAGNAKVAQEHCSDYVLLAEKLPEAPVKTGDSSNIALWIAVLGLGVVAIAGSVVMRKREF